MLEKERAKLILGQYKFKEGIKKLFSSREPKSLKVYKAFLNSNLKKLKRINHTATRAKISLEVNKKSTSPDEWQVERVSLNNIFAMMLGIIDARNEDYQRTKAFLGSSNSDDYAEDLRIAQPELSKYRIKIKEDYRALPANYKDRAIEETINCNPSHNNFDKLFDDMQKNHYQLSIQGQFISAYMFGYNNSLSILPDEIAPYYDKILSEYNLNKAKQNYNYKKVKCLTKGKIQ